VKPEPDQALVCVAGMHAEDGWKVAVMRGGGVILALTAEEARSTAAQLIDMAEICEGKWG